MSSKTTLADREALERFKEQHPVLNSVHAIAALSEDYFVTNYVGEFEGGARQARRAHKAAVIVQQQTAMVWANIQDAASTVTQSSLFGAVPPEFVEHQQSIPAYDRLFGNLDFIECDHCRSVLSPGAYFVDLMRFVEENIANSTIQNRRPDLFQLRLDCPNTDTLLPQIDIVNEVLEAVVTTEAEPEADGAIATAPFPMSLPLTLPLEAIRRYLQQRDLDLPQIYQAFAVDPEAEAPHIARETLALSPQDYDLLRLPNEDPTALAAYYGIDVNATGEGSLESVAVFLRQTGLSRQELDLLLFQDLDRFEVNAGLSRLFFINNVEDGLGYLDIVQADIDPAYPTRSPQETLVNLSPVKLDRIYRFLKLARCLDWSFGDLDWAIRSLYSPYAPERVLQFDGINDYVDVVGFAGLDGAAFTVEAWVCPARQRINPIVAKGDEASHATHFLLWIDADGHLAFYDSHSSATAYVRGLGVVPLGEFSHVAVTVNGQELVFYLNGRHDRTVPLAQAPTPVGRDLNIGRNLNDAYFEGTMKEVRVWAIALSQQQLETSRYQRLTGQEAGLAGYWLMTEDPQRQISDRSPGGHHGRLGGPEFITQPRWVYQDLVLDPLPQGVSDYGFSFNGQDQFLAAREVVVLDSFRLTLEAWLTLQGSGDWPILAKGREGTGQVQFALGVTAQGQISFRSTSLGDLALLSDGVDAARVPVNQPVHVAVTVGATGSGGSIQFYLNGQEVGRHTLATPPALEAYGDDLQIGRDFGNTYFRGLLREVRIWGRVRTAEQIDRFRQRQVPVAAPGLMGYWPLDREDDGRVLDWAYSQNHLFLGGILQDYQPRRIMAEPLLPDLPIAVSGNGLDLDGENEFIILQSPGNVGLGHYDRLTLEFWFKPANLGVRGDRPQILFVQGDGEAGLNLYLANQRLRVISWCANYERTEVQETVLTSAALTSDQWHHVAVINDESQSLDYIEFRAYVDGTPLTFDSSSHHSGALAAGQQGYRLSPVGLAYLGGVETASQVRFQGSYGSDRQRHFFAGQIADLRLWRRIKSIDEINRVRYAALTALQPDLVAYLPIDEGQGVAVTDRFGQGHRGELQQNETAFVTTASDPELQHLHSHYQPDGVDVLGWSNYTYSGKIYLSEPAPGAISGVGLTFCSRHPEGIDQYYRLQALWRDDIPQFQLVAHPAGVQPLTMTAIAADLPRPEADIWFNLRIEVSDNAAANRTDIRAKVWRYDQPEPANYQLLAEDSSDVRIASGTVGVWAVGQTGARRFDDLQVVAQTGAAPTPADIWLEEGFETYEPGENPAGWVDTGDRLAPPPTPNLFELLPLDRRSVFGTASDLANIHAHYHPDAARDDVLTWTDYSYRLRLRLGDPAAGLGVTVLSRYPAGIDQYYGLRRDVERPGFYLVANPVGIQRLQSLSADRDTRRSDIVPLPDIWYQVRVDVENQQTEGRTYVRAKIWRTGTLEPSAYQLEGFDDSDIRIIAGTVGLWSSGPGRKYFDQITVQRDVLLRENFDTYATDQDPDRWRDTGADNSREQDDSLFKTAPIDGNMAFATRSNRVNIHSHYDVPEALAWNRYIYSGRLRLSDSNTGGIGITFFSQYIDDQAEDHNRYYRLRMTRGVRNFHLSSHRNGQSLRDLRGETDTGITPRPNTWYLFLLEVEASSGRVNMRGKLWRDGEPEPETYQFNAFDDRDMRFTAGTVGLWTGHSGDKFFDDLEVRLTSFVSANFNLADWAITGPRQPQERNDNLFLTARVATVPRWLAIADYPLLPRPLDLRALQFDGVRQYLASNDLVGLELTRFTVEAWVRLTQHQPHPILAWLEPDGQTRLWFGIGSDDLLRLEGITPGRSLSGQAVMPLDQVVHVALTVDDTTATFYINGAADLTATLPRPITLANLSLEVGRDLNGQHFAGQMRDVRLWSRALTLADLAAPFRYQTPLPDAPDLVGHWAFNEATGLFTTDASVNDNDLRLGGLRTARRPRWQQAPLNPASNPGPEQEFWQGDRRALLFRQPGDRLDQASLALSSDPRRTVEVWFQVDDATIAHRKQIIYCEGDHQRGLVIYVYDGQLYFGGYNRPDRESGWLGTWLSTDRVESGRWHHAALVLDGRNDVRPDALLAYLDGKLVDIGPGSRLYYAAVEAADGGSDLTFSLSLGAATGAVRCHDDQVLADGSSQYLAGQLLELRLWNSARIPSQLLNNRYHQMSGQEPGLLLNWLFDSVAADLQILDLSPNGYSLTLTDGTRLLALQPLPPYGLPVTPLDQVALGDLAAIQTLLLRHRLPLDRLTALWFGLRYFGREDGRTLYDQIFNPTGLGGAPWAYYGQPPVRWDVTGREVPSRDRETRSRLMGALQVSSDDLDQLVYQLSQAETPLELDFRYLTRLFQLSQVPKALRLSLRDLLRLQALIGLEQVTTLESFLQLSNRADWMRRTGLSVEELDFFSNDVESDRISVRPDSTAIRDLAARLVQQSVDWLLRPNSFVTSDITEVESIQIFRFLQGDRSPSAPNPDPAIFIDDLGAVTPLYNGPADLTELATAQDWAADLRALGADIFAGLQTHGLINPQGIVLVDEIRDEGLRVLFGDRPPALTTLTTIRTALDRRLSIQTTISSTLVRLRNDHRSAILAELTELFNTEVERISILIDRFAEDVTPSNLLRWMQEIVAAGDNAPMPVAAADYFYRLGKLLRLSQRFELSSAETAVLLHHPEYFNVDQVLNPSLEDLDSLFTFTEMKAAFGDGSGQLVHLFSLDADDQDAVVEAIVAIAPWDPQQVRDLMAHLGNTIPYNRTRGFNRLRQGFDLAVALRTDIGFLVQLADTSLLAPQADVAPMLEFYRSMEAALLKVLRALYDDEQWPSVYRPIRDPLAEQKRDALLSLAMLELTELIRGSAALQGAKLRLTPDLLYEYLLLDVQVSSAVETSRLVQAIASLQLYIQRCLMGLERDVTVADAAAQQWEWMKNYRVWEANRKVFLYPENYLEPELRDLKTPLFEDLELELMQADINQESVTRAYANYLTKFEEIANLKVVGTYLHKPLDNEQTTNPDDILYLIGRTNTQPRIYYYRQYNVTNDRWLPWQTIDLTINSDFVTPVYAFNRLFVFWTEFSKVTQSVDLSPVERRTAEGQPDFLVYRNTGQRVEEKLQDDWRRSRKSIDSEGHLVSERTGERVQINIDVFNPIVKYSYYSFNDAWVAPQTYLELNNELPEDVYIRPEWQRVYAQRVLEFFQDPPQQPADQILNNVRVLQVSRNTTLSSPTPNFDTRTLTWSFWARFANTLVGGSLSGEQAATEADLAGYRRALALVTYQQTVIDNGGNPLPQTVLQAIATNNFSRIPGAPDLAALNRAVGEATTARNQAQIAYLQAKAAADADPNNAAAQATATTTRQAFDQAQTNLTQAQTALTQGRRQPQWESLNMTVGFYLGRNLSSPPAGPAAGSINVNYGNWHHLALTLTYDGSAYSLQIYRHGVAATAPATPIQPAPVSMGLLPAAGTVVIGQTDAQTRSIETAYEAFMGEFRLWDEARSGQTIVAQRDERKDGANELGLFHLPLDQREAGATMRLVESNLTLRRVFLPIQPVSERERVLVFYGNEIRSLRNNLEDHSFTLELRPVSFADFNYELNLYLSRLYLTQTRGLSINDYASGDRSTVQPSLTARIEQTVLLQYFAIANLDPSHPFRQYLERLARLTRAEDNFLLDNLSQFDVSLADVNNQPGWYILDTGDEQFLLQPSDNPALLSTAERIEFSYGSNQQALLPQALSLSFGTDPALEVSNSTVPAFQFERLNTFAVHELTLRLFRGGIDELLSLDTQQTLKEADFTAYFSGTSALQAAVPSRVIPPNYRPGGGPSSHISQQIDRQIDFEGAYGLYYREIFFHIPWFIANQLNASQNFGEAQRWYHYIFNPAPQTAGPVALDPSRFWRYRPFRNLTVETLTAMLQNQAALAEYRSDPFDPHAIARLRMTAYQKAIVMRYVDNLLDWGDSLFRQDTRESINEAVLLYVLAATLLGPRPQASALRKFEEIGDYDTIRAAFDQLPPNDQAIPDFLFQLAPALRDGLSSGSLTLPHNGRVVTTFCVPENSEFLGYWDRVGDRLFNIRHSLNIDGIFRQLALFQPPIDVRALVQAAAAGGRDIGSLLADLNVAVPHYRYSFMLDRAKEMVGNAKDFGAALLSAIESRDGEDLAVLENTHARSLLNLLTRTKELARDEAKITIETLEISRQRIINRRDHFQALIDDGLIAEEVTELVLTAGAQAIRIVGSTVKALEGVIGSVPQVKTGGAGAGGSPYAVVEVGGKQLEPPVRAAAEIALIIAETLDVAANITGKVGEYKRRANDWDLELNTSRFDLDEVDRQLEAAQVQLEVAERELAAHQLEIQQNQEIASFYRSKFTNQALYGWMVSRLSSLYFQAYKLAYDFAKAAERGMQYELPSNNRFISFGHWDSLRRGLLAGESLQLELNRMEKYQLDNDSRFLEIEKNISMQQVMPARLNLLKDRGLCEFQLTEEMFDRDYPGHYFRVLKTVAITIKVPRSPYQVLHATLTQLGSKTLVDPSIDGVRYLLGIDGSPQPSSDTLRVNWRANQQIAISKADDDLGMFALDFFFDDRYFPFEGTGAVSAWRLEMPKRTNPTIDFNRIEDVIIHLRYTSKADSGRFKQEVEGEVF